MQQGKRLLKIPIMKQLLTSHYGTDNSLWMVEVFTEYFLLTINNVCICYCETFHAGFQCVLEASFLWIRALYHYMGPILDNVFNIPQGSHSPANFGEFCWWLGHLLSKLCDTCWSAVSRQKSDHCCNWNPLINHIVQVKMVMEGVYEEEEEMTKKIT